jgi:hypothetical protein
MGKPWSGCGRGLAAAAQRRLGPPSTLALALVLVPVVVSCRHGSPPAAARAPASDKALPAVPVCAPSPTAGDPPAPAASTGGAQWRAYRQTVVSVVRVQSRSLTTCYDAALTVDPAATARLTFEWTIDVNGAVKAVCVTKQPDEKTSSMVRCMGLIVTGWTFPPPGKEPAHVSFPFVFLTAPDDEPSHRDEPRAPETIAP